MSNPCAGKTYNLIPCQAPAKVERDGKWYCGRHDPVAVAARRKRLAEDRKAKSDKTRADYERIVAEKAEMQRRADCYGDLLEALKVCRGYVHIYSDAALIDAAIKKAEGK